MKHPRMRKGWQLVLNSPIAIGLVATTGNAALAQTSVVPDDTLGRERSIVNAVNAQQDRISGGAIRNTNLFHSFRAFSIPEGRTVEFSNPPGIRNIFSRVTGTSPSNILGLLGVAGNVNLFLINPNGILFGPNAKFAINGSFVASTANSIIFSDGSQFSATRPQAPPLLTVDVPVPVGLQFEGQPSGVILNHAFLQPGQNSTLVGGTVLSTNQISTPNGEAAIATVTTPQIVPLDESVKLPQNFQPLTASASQLAAKVALPESFIESARNAGLEVNSNGQVISLPSALPLEKGDIAIRVLGQTAISGNKVILSAANDLKILESQVTTRTGNVYLSARDTVQFQKGGRVVMEVAQDGNIGDVEIKAGNDVLFDGLPGTPTRPNEPGEVARVVLVTRNQNNAGNLTLNAGNRVVFTNGAYVDTSTQGSGKGGDVTIQASNLVSFNRGAFVDVGTSSQGNGGSATIQAVNGSVLFNESSVRTLTLRKGDAGSLTIQADNGSVSFINSEINANSGGNDVPNVTGNAGNVTIQATNGSVNFFSSSEKQSAAVFAITFGSGRGGNIAIQATKDISLKGEAGRFLSSSGLSGSNPSIQSKGGGSVDLRANSITIRDGAQVEAGTFNAGNGGSVTLGAAGIVRVMNGSGVSVSSKDGSGNAGNLKVDAKYIILDTKGGLTATSEQSNGGNIQLQAKNVLLMRHKSLISALSEGTNSQDGNIEINARGIVAIPKENSDIAARSAKKGSIDFKGTPAMIGLKVNKDFNLTPISEITATGGVNLTLGVDPTSGLVRLPEEPRSAQLSEGCEAGAGQESSSFTNIGRGGSPQRPEDPLNADFALDSESDTRQAIAPNETIDLIESSQTAARLILPCQRQQ